MILLMNYVSTPAYNTGVPEAHVVGIYKRDWIKVRQNMSGVKFYIDSKHEKTGRFRRTLEVESYARPISKGVMSTLMEKEFDCAEERSRTIDNKLYDENLKVIGEIGGKDWKFAAPNTTGYDTIQVACKTKKGEEFGVENETIESLMETFAFGIKRQQLKK